MDFNIIPITCAFLSYTTSHEPLLFFASKSLTFFLYSNHDGRIIHQVYEWLGEQKHSVKK
jgi:hypothetical protein